LSIPVRKYGKVFGIIIDSGIILFPVALSLSYKKPFFAVFLLIAFESIAGILGQKS
jgi:hypothetical protein